LIALIKALNIKRLVDRWYHHSCNSAAIPYPRAYQLAHHFDA
jgi:hypothetical protein